MGDLATNCLIVWVETSNFLTFKKFQSPRHGGCDVAYLTAAA
jgi:hypothetical protein